MFFKKEKTNDALLEALDGGSVENVLKGGKLISDSLVNSESDREAIFRVCTNKSLAKARLLEIQDSDKYGFSFSVSFWPVLFSIKV